MVDQNELDTAEAMGNGGRERLPAYTTAPYKWNQLREQILQSLSEAKRNKYMQWKEVDDPAKREENTNTCYWEAATENPGVVAWYSAWRLEAEVITSLQVMKDVISSPAVPDIEERNMPWRSDLPRRWVTMLLKIYSYICPVTGVPSMIIERLLNGVKAV